MLFEFAPMEGRGCPRDHGAVSPPASFSDAAGESMDGDLHDPISVLYRLKEYWSYLSWNIEDSRKVQKKIMNTRNMDEYHHAVRQLLL